MVLESFFFFLCFKIVYSLANCGNPSSKQAAYHIMTLPCMASSNIKCQTSLYLIQNFLSRHMHFYYVHQSYAHEHFRCHPCIGPSLSHTLMPDFYTNVQSLPHGQSQQTPQLNHKTQPQPDAKLHLLFVACLMCATLLVLILLSADLVVHDKMFAQICILLKFRVRTKFEILCKQLSPHKPNSLFAKWVVFSIYFFSCS